MDSNVGVIVGLVLTLFIYSYLVGDNPLYRIATHLLVGVSAAYAAVVLSREVLVPILGQIAADPGGAEAILWYVPAVLALLLFVRRNPSIGWLSNGAIAFLVGVGAAVALVGAILGTLWPQMTSRAAGNGTQGILLAVFTVCALLTFHFTGRLDKRGEWVRPYWQRGLVLVGRAVITVTFGALFTTVFNTSLVLLIDRVNFILGIIS
jgi:hypothetical protein